MTSLIPARRERLALADLAQSLGPDQPTLCDGWDVADLAAHVVVRERRPDAAAGMMVPALARHRRAVRDAEATRPFDELVARLRDGPPSWSPFAWPAVDGRINTMELFIHHEDVRRGQPGWEPRTLDPDLEQALADTLVSMASRMASAAPCGVLLRPDGRPPIVARRDVPTVELFGPVGELVLFLSGRGAHARVDVRPGPDADETLAAQVRATSFGM